MSAPAKQREPEAWELPFLPYFTHEILAHDWPPGWLPAEDGWGRNHVRASELASANREARVLLGDLGTIVGISEKSDARLRDVGNRPGWMEP